MGAFCGAQEDKQHLNLSQHAQNIIKNDRAAFRCKNQTAFINHVFHAFRRQETCRAVLSRTLENEQKELKKKIEAAREKNVPLPHPEAIDQVLDAIKSQRRKELITEFTDCLPKGDGIKFRLNNQNYEYLNDDVLCPESEFYDRSGQYIKAVMEEYAALPFIDREAVYYSKELEMIRQHIESGKELLVRAKSGIYYHVRPYRIVKDVYHYLVCLSYPHNGKPSLATPHSFRVSNAVLKESGRKSFISKEEKKQMDTLIRQKGAAFIGGQSDLIRVRLSDEGIGKYQRILHLRPDTATEPEEDGHLLTFHCTPSQIEVYFQRFGKDAQVLSPAFLAERFRQFYQSAYEEQTKSMEENPFPRGKEE